MTQFLELSNIDKTVNFILELKYIYLYVYYIYIHIHMNQMQTLASKNAIIKTKNSIYDFKTWFDLAAERRTN